jgi:4-hydroxyphenylpyruvate dioxygenase
VFEERFFFELVERRNYQSFGAASAAIRLAAQAREVGPAEAAAL